MSDFLERLKTEKQDLREKTEKLVSFIGTDNFLKLSSANQHLLIEQKEVMIRYHSILEIRIELLSE